ncbi:MAG: STAS domain-containing protein [Planctomycetes bacterium]|nr:STAS domain-containing protein [Planctomycetota bacterium]
MRRDAAEGAQISKEFKNDVCILHLSGQMREMGADVLREELDQVLENGDYKLIFEMGDVSFISSTGLGQIMRAFRTAGQNDGFVRVVNPQPLVEEVFRATKLHTLIGIFSTIEDAIDEKGRRT